MFHIHPVFNYLFVDVFEDPHEVPVDLVLGHHVFQSVRKHEQFCSLLDFFLYLLLQLFIELLLYVQLSLYYILTLSLTNKRVLIELFKSDSLFRISLDHSPQQVQTCFAEEFIFRKPEASKPQHLQSFQLFHILSIDEGWLASQHFIKHQPQRPQVDFIIIRGKVVGDFRGGVKRSANVGHHHVLLRRNDLGKPQVSDLQSGVGS